MTIADPDLQTGKGGGEGGRGHPDPEISRGQSQKKFFSALLASVWSTNKGVGPGPPGPSPGSASVRRAWEHNGWNNHARILNLFWLLKWSLYTLNYYKGVKTQIFPWVRSLFILLSLWSRYFKDKLPASSFINSSSENFAKCCCSYRFFLGSSSSSLKK